MFFLWLNCRVHDKLSLFKQEPQQIVGENTRSTSLISPCQTWAKTLEWKAMWRLSTPQSSFAALNPSTASLPVSPTWKWTPHGPPSTRCSSVTPTAWVWAKLWLIFHLTSPTRKRTGSAWWTPTQHVCRPLASSRWVAPQEGERVFELTLQRLHSAAAITITAREDPDVLGQKTLSTWWPSGGSDLRRDPSFVSVRIMIASPRQEPPGISLASAEVGDTSLSSSGSAPEPLQIWLCKTPGPAEPLAWANTLGTITTTTTGAPLAPRPLNQRTKVTSWASPFPDLSSCATSAIKSWCRSTAAAGWEEPTAAGRKAVANAGKAKTA